jgi:hypothetical protein
MSQGATFGLDVLSSKWRCRLELCLLQSTCDYAWYLPFAFVFKQAGAASCHVVDASKTQFRLARHSIWYGLRSRKYTSLRRPSHPVTGMRVGLAWVSVDYLVGIPCQACKWAV